MRTTERSCHLNEILQDVFMSYLLRVETPLSLKANAPLHVPSTLSPCLAPSHAEGLEPSGVAWSQPFLAQSRMILVHLLRFQRPDACASFSTETMCFKSSNQDY